ncbi:MAG: phosphopantetheine-binding protein [Nocardioides sp.]|uniref:phosphopantetheine-binding protein n=1 Tax=Nocardioides sp. TaxID=35761 RepID=UPI003D6C6889
METLDRAAVRDLMGEVLAVQSKTLPDDDTAKLADIGFRSLDFSELALRIEDETGDELNFEAAGLRSIETVADVLDLLVEIQSQ